MKIKMQKCWHCGKNNAGRKFNLKKSQQDFDIMFISISCRNCRAPMLVEVKN